MTVFLAVLKIIGLVLLALLGIFILICLLALLVPLRYEIKGEFTDRDNNDFVIRLSWLLRLLQLKLAGHNGDVSKKISVFGFRLKRRKRAKTKTRNKKNTNGQKNGEQDADFKGNNAIQEKVEEASEENKSREVCIPQQEEASLELCNDEEVCKRKGFMAKVGDFCKEIPQKIKSFFEKIFNIFKSVYEKLKNAASFLNDENNRQVFADIKGEVFYLIKHFRPRRWKGRLTVGTGDPAATGYLLGAVYAFYPIHAGHLFITPDFDNRVFYGSIHIKGRIRGVHAILTVIRLFTNKKFMKMIKK